MVRRRRMAEGGCIHVMIPMPATMVARLSKKSEIRQEMSPVVGFRLFMNATPQEFLKLAGCCQSLTYEAISRGRFDPIDRRKRAALCTLEAPMKTDYRRDELAREVDRREGRKRYV